MSEMAYQLLLNLAICASQLANVLCFGDCDEMLSARAWRLKADPLWGWVRVILDTVYPLSQWKGKYASHCEACYYAEKRRLQERILLYSDLEPEEVVDVQEG